MSREEASRTLPAPFPTTKEGREAAKAFFRENKDTGRTQYFIKPDGSIHYVDNKGDGKLGFRNLHSKLKSNADYRARKFDATPSKADYIRIFGEQKGVDLFTAEQEKVRSIYRNYDPLTHDIDHPNALYRGGIQHSNNLIALDSSVNRSKGAIPLDKISKAALLLADNIDDQLKLQGPLPTTEMRQQIALKSVSRVSKAGKLMSSLDKLDKFGKVAAAVGVVLTVADGLSRGASAGEITNEAGGQIFDFINPIDGGGLNGRSLQQELARAEQYTNGNRPKDPFANGVFNGLANMAGNEIKYWGDSFTNGKIPYIGD
tara:strand:+ start:4184 stop:5131 length:948 start_codon:yes stop_codon:yes gene_type:complete